ncbi:retrovirus-related pol polyprotein from transposon TNT 1-94 [Tanacetum coccineum]
MNCARPVSNVYKRAHSHVKRPFNKFKTNKNNNFNEKVNTVKGNVTNVGPKAVVSDDKGNEANARPKQKVLDHGNPQQDLKDKRVIDSGCSRHMIGNRSYLTDYEDIDGGFVAFGGSRKPALIFMRPFGCPVTILNTIDHLGKFNGKADEGFFVGYSTNSKAFRVFNSKTRIVEENLHVQKHVMMQNSKDSPDAGFKPSGEEEKKDAEDLGKDSEIPSIKEPRINQENDASVNSTNNINTVSPTVNATNIEDNDVDENIVYGCADDPNIPKLEDIVYSDDDEDVGAEADIYACQSYSNYKNTQRSSS